MYKEEKEYIKPAVEASLQGDFNKDSQLKIYFIYEGTTAPYTEDITEMWQISGNVFQKMTDQLYLTFEIFYGQGTYIPSDSRYSLVGLKSELRYDPISSIQLKVGYEFRLAQSGNDARFRYERNIVYFECKGVF